MTYFFIHTPKTSGTTFVDVLQRDKRNLIGYFYPPKSEMDNFEKRVKEAPYYNLTKNPDWKKFNFIVGHFTFGIHNVLNATDFKYIGVIRNPIEHYISLYRNFLRMPEDYKDLIIPGNPKPIENLIKLDYTHNMQTWFLSGLTMEEIRNNKERAYQTVIDNSEKYFEGIYPTERFDEGLFYFKHKIGITPIYHTKKNVATNTFEQKLSENLLQQIRTINDVDFRLFEYFSSRFDKDINKIKGIKLELLYFKLMNGLNNLVCKLR